MATAVRNRHQYATYGNVAYRTGYDGSAVRVPGREEELAPRVRPRRKAMARPRIRVREAGEVSLFAVFGFVTIFVLAVSLIMSYSQMSTVYTETVHLRSQLTALQKEEASLLAQQEMAYDLREIEAQVTDNGSMSKPKSSQQVVLDSSDTDSVIIYQKENNSMISVLGELRENAGTLFSNVMSYFH